MPVSKNRLLKFFCLPIFCRQPFQFDGIQVGWLKQNFMRSQSIGSKSLWKRNMAKMCLWGRLWPQLASYVPLAMWANIESNNLRCPSNQFARQLPHFAALPSCFYVGSIQFKVQLETARIRLFLTVAKLLSNSSLAALPPAQHRNLFAIPCLFREANFSATLWTFNLTSLWETDNNLSGVFHVKGSIMWLDQTAMKLSLRALHPQALKADTPLNKKNPQSSN